MGAPLPDGQRGVYGISVAAELVGMGPQTLRLYEARGLLEPTRTEAFVQTVHQVMGGVVQHRPPHVHGQLHASWATRTRRATATLTGVLNGQPVRLRMLAP